MLFRRHKNTVRNWLKVGLQPVDDRRPILILGRELLPFPARLPRARETAVRARSALLRLLPSPQVVRGSAGRLRGDHVELWKSEGAVFRLRYPHVSEGFTAEAGNGCR